MSDAVFEPSKFYDAVVRCSTETCPNSLKEPVPVTELYSNGGIPGIQCGLCNRSMKILSAVLMDPQPELS
ncbi:hypothetical protein [Streptomyces sp. NPDC086782]|uniref:hypothetical protein n=1 Tax=Streptomyces sp. NPDC086782 TaxID=3365757 RepID=UPI00382529D4